MNTTFMTVRPESVTDEQRAAICRVTMLGFERPEDEADPAQVLEHLEEADAVQLAYSGQQLIGFAMYGRSLWRGSN